MKKIPPNTSDETVRRANETIAINPTSGRITPGMRRLFNAMLYFSQKDGLKEIYTRPLAEVLGVMDSKNRNTTELKEQLVMMRKTEVEWNSRTDEETRWGTTGLISQAEIIEHASGRKQVEWCLPPKIRDRLLDALTYTKLSLQIHSSLRSGASIALYEICSRYATSPTSRTMREHWDWWRPRLTGNPEPEANNEYKYFKRDVLKLSIAEVNAMADIKITLIEYKNGRRIEEIQFYVERKENVLGTPPPAESIDVELLAQIMQLGVPQKEARKICQDHDAAFLYKTIAATNQRAAAENMGKLKSPAAYFKAAIKGRYVAAAAEKIAPAAPKDTQEVQKARVSASYQADRVKTAFDAYKELDTDEQTALLDTFRSVTSVAQYRTELRNHGISKSQALRVAFCEWYAEKLWGMPNDADLLEFLIASPPKATQN